MNIYKYAGTAILVSPIAALFGYGTWAFGLDFLLPVLLIPAWLAASFWLLRKGLSK